MGVKVTGPIVRKAASDTYPTHENRAALEGFYVVDDIAGRNAIPNDVRGTKCCAFVIDSDGAGNPNIYIIDDTTNITDDANWALFQSAVISGGLSYQGQWDASTNTPALADGGGTAGYFYVASASGSVDFGSGSISFNIGDWVIYDSGVWSKLTQSGATNDWNTMVNKPSTFPPSSHAHIISDVTGLQLALDAKIDNGSIETASISGDAALVVGSNLILDHFSDATIHFEISDGETVDNKVWSSTKIDDEFLTRTLTPAQINTLIAGASTYGIRFYAHSVTDPRTNYTASATEFDYLLETDTRDVYQFVSSAWVLRYNLDAANVDNDATMGGASPSGSTILGHAPMNEDRSQQNECQRGEPGQARH